MVSRQLLEVVADPDDDRVPVVARDCVAALGAQSWMLKAQILEFNRRIMAWHRSNETSKRLDEIPGVLVFYQFTALACVWRGYVLLHENGHRARHYCAALVFLISALAVESDIG
jgi:hypothetical protein